MIYVSHSFLVYSRIMLLDYELTFFFPPSSFSIRKNIVIVRGSQCKICAILNMCYFNLYFLRSIVSGVFTEIFVYRLIKVNLTCDQALFSFSSVKHSGGTGETKNRAWYNSSTERLPPTFLIDWHSTKQPIKWQISHNGNSQKITQMSTK